MGLKAAIAKAAASAFTAVGDVVETTNIIRYDGDPVRDLSTGLYTRPQTVLSDVKIIWMKVQRDRWADFEISYQDRQALVLQALAPGIKVGDVIQQLSAYYEIMLMNEDPAHASFVLLCRTKRVVT